MLKLPPMIAPSEAKAAVESPGRPSRGGGTPAPSQTPDLGRQMKIRPLFAWYDLWVGAFWDRKARKLYLLPLPCLGVVVEF